MFDQDDEALVVVLEEHPGEDRLVDVEAAVVVPGAGDRDERRRLTGLVSECAALTPRGEETSILLLEPHGTINTGETRGDLTAEVVDLP